VVVTKSGKLDGQKSDVKRVKDLDLVGGCWMTRRQARRQEQGLKGMEQEMRESEVGGNSQASRKHQVWIPARTDRGQNFTGYFQI
jgi:hypothetical protein